MKKYVVFMLILLTLMSSISLYSEDVKMVIGLSLPPYIFSDNNNGIEYDIVKEALNFKGHTLIPVYVPFARVLREIELKHVDGALTVNESSGLKNVFYSNPDITYQNVVITLESSGLVINSVEDLKDIRVTGFMNAKMYLGEKFKSVMDKSKKYDETNNQEVQVALLFNKRVQALVCDINIFKYYQQNNTKANCDAKVVIHKIFPATDYKVAFRDKNLRDDFNEGLKFLKDSGKYQKIYQRYIK